MAIVKLRDNQVDAVKRMHTGCILWGGVGSGKSITSLAYYYIQYGGQLNTTNYVRMVNPPDLYIITTAHKRDLFEWEGELSKFYLSTDKKVNLYSNKIVVDSWNNIKKYVDVKNAFFIFDEQRLVGYGAWVKTFFKIAAYNKWILLSATPGDSWSDYMPVFIANGFFRNKTDFERKHVVFNPFTKYKSVLRYTNEGSLIKMRNRVLVKMGDLGRNTVRHYETLLVTYDRNKYDIVANDRWNIYQKKPIENSSEYCYTLHKVVNSDSSRSTAIVNIMEVHPKVIIFYNYDYELEILRNLFKDFGNVREWNGHKHEELPTGNSWAFLVQYTSGCEGWNCITTDTIIFYSQNYSYKVMEQAAGRIDRLNTPYKDLYYFYLKSSSKIDKAISMALSKKKKFNERGFAGVFKNDKPQQLKLFDLPNDTKKDFDPERDCIEHSSFHNPIDISQ